MGQTNQQKKKQQRKKERENAIKLERNIRRNTGTSLKNTQDLVDSFGSNVIELLTNKENMKIALNTRIRQIQYLQNDYPGKIPGVNLERFLAIREKFPELDKSVSAMCRLKGKVDDLTTNEDKMFEMAEHLGDLTECQFIFEGIRQEMLAAEKEFAAAMEAIHRKARPQDLEKDLKVEKPEEMARLENTAGPKTPKENLLNPSEKVENAPVTETPEGEWVVGTPEEKVSEEHQDVEVDVPQEQAEAMMQNSAPELPAVETVEPTDPPKEPVNTIQEVTPQPVAPVTPTLHEVNA